MSPRWSVVRLWACVFVWVAGCSEASCRGPESPSSVVEPTPEASEPGTSLGADVSWAEIDSPAAVGALGASLTATPEAVLVSWLEPRDEEAHAVRFATLEGDEWSDVYTVAEADDLIANWADFPRAALGGDGATYVHYLRRSGSAAHAYEIQLTRLRSGATSFEALGAPHRDGTPTEHGFVSMVPESDGVRLFWLDGRASVQGGATAIYTTRVGEVVAAEQRIDDKTCDCCQTDAALTAAGPVVVYRDREAGEVRDVAIARFADAAFGTSPVHRDEWEMAGCPVNGPAIDAEARHAAVAWFTGADGGSTRLAFSDDAGGSFEGPIVFDADQPLGRVDVALVEGGAAVSWLARGDGEAEVRVRLVHRDGRLGAPTIVARTASARASGFPVMVRDGARLLVAYRDGQEPPRVHLAQLPVADLPREVAEHRTAATPAELGPGDAMPEASIRDLAGETVPLSSLAERRPLVVAFFARWCQPCRDELAQLEAVRELLGPDVSLVAVSIDEGSVERAVAVARRWGFTGQVVSDAGAASSLGVPPIPALFVFDAGGVLRAAWRGRAVTAAEVVRTVAELGPS